MLTTIKGIFDDGKIILDEMPQSKIKSKVIVTFLEEIETPVKQRRLGRLKGKISIPDNFNDPLDDLKGYMY